MAWRIAESVVRGGIDNRLPGIIKGTLYLEGLKEPIILELEGNCDPDLAGRNLTFRGLMPIADQSLEALSRVQCGEAGTMTATNMVRIPTIPREEVDRCIQERKCIPTRWSESLYLEWFSSNGRVLVEGSSFACTLSPARWKLSEETHQWIWRLKERHGDDFLFDHAENCTEDAEESNEDATSKIGPSFRIETVNGARPHPLVQRVSEFLLRMIFESKSQKFYIEDAIENYPVEGMIEATSKANIRLAHTMAKAREFMTEPDLREFIHGLKRARWALGEATENAGLAKHMGSADHSWLNGLRREFREMRKEIRSLIHEYEDRNQKPPTAGTTAPVEASS